MRRAKLWPALGDSHGLCDIRYYAMPKMGNHQSVTTRVQKNAQAIGSKLHRGQGKIRSVVICWRYFEEWQNMIDDSIVIILYSKYSEYILYLTKIEILAIC